jgi:putative tryptophan/tyrosine transport system substrate-binding protein
MERRESRLSRRTFVRWVAGLGLLAGCGRLPFQSPPPTAVRVHRLGFLSGANPTTGAGTLDLFRQALGELGYVEGQNLAIESRWGEGSDARLAEPAAELARLPVDLIIVPSVTVARLTREATTTVPIVLAGAGDPVAAGLAASYARPGGNVTGMTNLSTTLFGKRLQLLKEAAPSITRVAVVWDPTLPALPLVDAWPRDAQAVGVQLHIMEPRSPEEINAAFETAAREGADALLRGPGPLSLEHRGQVIQRVARLGWPAMYDQRQFVEDGGLMAYAANPTDLWRRTAVYVDKILKGANPAELPIEQPTRFDFVVNLSTARDLGLTLPESIRLQVTEVIQ